MVQGLVAGLRRFDGDAEVLLGLGLTDHFAQSPGTQREFPAIIGILFR